MIDPRPSLIIHYIRDTERPHRPEPRGRTENDSSPPLVVRRSLDPRVPPGKLGSGTFRQAEQTIEASDQLAVIFQYNCR